MDELADKLSEILGDPESMEKIKSIAGSLGLGESKEEPPKNTGGEDMLGKIMPLISAYSAADKDPKVQLLYALKPYLHGARAEHINDVAMILKVLSILGESGINGKLL